MRILVLSNSSGGLFSFRRELLEELVKFHMKVYISVPIDTHLKDIEEIGCKVEENKYLERRNTNPIHDLKLLIYYCRLIKNVRPDVVLTYTIKPNAYGGFICGMLKIPYISNITGLGTSIANKGLLRFITLIIYKIGLRKCQRVFFQNPSNKSFMLLHRIINHKQADLIPGSGVNTVRHYYEIYPSDKDVIIFTTIGRIMKDKGIDDVLDAAKYIKTKFPKTIFRLIGDFDEKYEKKVKEMSDLGIIEYIGYQNDIHPWIAESHAIIHASYHEGMSNILLEAASTGRPVIATDIHGCIETFEPDITGIAFHVKDVNSLVMAIEKFLTLDNSVREEMGRKGREKMVQEFERKIVIDKYIKEIRKAKKKANAM